jgi:ribosomal protein L11 methyltransferase
VRSYPAIALTWTGPGDADREDRLLAELDGLRVTAIEDRDDGLRVFFQSTSDRDDALRHLRTLTGLVTTAADIPDEDWAARSQASIGPVTIGRITVAPPWSVTPALTAQSDITIVIQPSMGFGTGHHASTRLCLRWLQTLALGGANVLDAGTGSGVLAIAAATLGAARAVGIDVDPDAIESARENVELNDIGDRVALREHGLADAASTFGQAFDVILANLTGGLLCRDAGAFLRLATPNARLIVSGFERPERAQVAGAFEDAGWLTLGDVTEDGWVALLLSPAPR